MCRIAMAVILLTLFVQGMLPAQSFSVGALPRYQKLSGATAVFTVRVTPYNGFDASVFLSASIPTLPHATIDILPYLSAPFTDSATLRITLTGAKEEGEHPVIIEGKNGPLIVRDTVTLAIAGKSAWRVFSTLNAPLQDDRITAVAVDRDGIGWVGTWYGLARFDGTNWTAYDADNAPFVHKAAVPTTANRIVALAVDSNNGVWVRTELGRLARYYNGSWKLFDRGVARTPVSYREYRSSIAAGPGGVVWITTNDSLLKYDGNTWTVYTSANSELLPDPRYVAVDHDGRVYVTNIRNQISRFDGTFWKMITIGSHMLWPTYPQGFTISIDNNNDAWAVGVGWVVSLSDATAFEGQTGSGTEVGFPGKMPYAIAFDDQGVMWIATVGLGRKEGDEWWYYSIGNSGLPGTNVECLVVGPGREIWIGTEKGLAILDGNTAPGAALSSVRIAQNTSNRILTGVSPNPLNGNGALRLSQMERGIVRVEIVDLLGQTVREVLNDVVEPGEHRVPLSGYDIPAGRYILRLTADKHIETMPVIILP